MTARRSIAVRILGQEYRIASDADEAGEAQVRRAAALVDETMGRIRERGGVDTLHVAVLAALNLANRLVGRREGRRAEPAEWIEADRVEALIRLVESAGAGGTANP